MKVVWLFGESCVGKKTLINKMSLYSTTFFGNRDVRKIFGMSDKTIIMPLTVDRYNFHRKKEIVNDLFSLRGNKAMRNYVVFIHGQIYDMNNTLDDLSKTEGFNDFNFCYYLLPTKMDYRIRRTSRTIKHKTDYKALLEKKDKTISILSKFFDKIKTVTL